MIEIKVTDDEKGFKVEVVMEGSLDLIAQQMNTVMKAITERSPKLLKRMMYYEGMKLENEEV